MKNNKVFDLWLSEFSFDEIAQMSNISVEEVKTQLKKHMEHLDIEEDEKYRDVWRKFNFNKEFFIQFFNESELIYSYLTLVYPKGKLHPLYLVFEDDYSDKMNQYLQTNKVINIVENDQINVEIKKKYINGEKLNESELLEVGFLPCDRFVKYFTTYAFSEELFTIIFKVTKSEYQYLVNRFEIGKGEFADFVKNNPSNEYALRYKLHNNIHVLNKNKPTKSDKKISDLKELEDKLITLIDEPKRKKQIWGTRQVKLELFKPNLSAIFEKIAPKFTHNEQISFDTKVNSKLSHRSLTLLKKSHQDKIVLKDNDTYTSTLETYKQMIQNVKPRFDVKKEVK